MEINEVGEKHEQAVTNCHGTSFADGKYWLEPDQVPTLLAHDGYKQVNYDDRKEGDKVIYSSGDLANHNEDSRTLTKDIGKVYGQGGLQISNYESPIEATWKKEKDDVRINIYRKTGKDKQFKTDAELQAFKKQAFTYNVQTPEAAKKAASKELIKINNRKDNLKFNNKVQTKIVPASSPDPVGPKKADGSF